MYPKASLNGICPLCQRDFANQFASEMLSPSYYDYLGVPTWASVKEIRRAYRELSKRYHPDTSVLSPELARKRFEQLNEAYIVLSNPTQRALYDGRSGFGSIPIVTVQPPAGVKSGTAGTDSTATESLYEVARRPLSDSEHFALFAMGATVVLCLFLVAWMTWIV